MAQCWLLEWLTTLTSMMHQPCPQPMHPHSDPTNANHNTVANNEFVNYYVCPMETDKACHWLATCWPMSWSFTTKTPPTLPCHHHATTNYKNMTTHFASCHDDEYFQYKLTFNKIDEACKWMMLSWPMEWLKAPTALLHPPCNKHMTTDVEIRHDDEFFTTH